MGKKKPKKAAVLTDFLTAASDDAGGGANATPTIDSPLTNSFVPPGVALTVSVSTNRGDLSYKVVFTDQNPPPGAETADVGPSNGSFNVVIPGNKLVANRLYQIRVFVAPASGNTPPHLDHTITVHTQQPDDQPVIIMDG